MATFLVSGLWHGANWTFVVWGGLHGAYQVLEILFRPARHKAWRGAVTFALVTFAWIFFKAESLHAAAGFIGRLFTRPDPQALLDGSLLEAGLDGTEWAVLGGALALMLVVDIYKNVRKVSIADFVDRQSAAFRIAAYIGVILMVYVFGIYGSSFDAGAFLYFRF
jgi:hypothetical protein